MNDNVNEITDLNIVTDIANEIIINDTTNNTVYNVCYNIYTILSVLTFAIIVIFLFKYLKSTFSKM